MKKTTILSILLGAALNAMAAPRGEVQARAIAAQFLSNMMQRSGAKGGSAVQPLSLAATSSSILGNSGKAKGQQGAADNEALYIYNMGSEAFAIVSGDDNSQPILAYGNQGAFVTDNLPDHIKRWLQTYVDEQNYYATLPPQPLTFTAPAPATVPAASPAGTTAPVPEASASGIPASASGITALGSYPAAVAPILLANGTPIQWDQNEPFYNKCPNYLGNRSVVGCVATTLAQLMYYNRWPMKGSGSFNYISPSHNIPVSCDFSSMTFDYDKILPHYYAGRYTEEQAEQAANLSFAAGVAVEMDYSPNGSGTSSMFIGSALVKYFNYDKNIHYALRDYYTQAEWIDMLKSEINAGRPVCYNGFSTSIGHQFIFDGYDENNFVHINWGWAGMSDGYYSLSALSPSSVGTGGGSVTSGGFCFDQGMWLGMQKPSEETVPSSFFIIDNASIKANKETAIPGEDITVSLPNCYNASVDFKGEMGLILVAADGSTTVLDRGQMTLRSGFGKVAEGDIPAMSFEGKFANDIADGSYQLCIATKQDGEPTWKRVRSGNGYNDSFDMTVKDGSITLTPMVITPKAEGSLRSDHTIYTRCRSQFTATLTNTSTSEFFGLAHIGIYKDVDGEPTLIALCGKSQVTLPVGEETEVVFKGSIESYGESATVNAGDYKACVLLEHQDKLYQVGNSIDVTIKRIPSGMAKLTADDFTIVETTVPLDGTLYGHVNVTNTNSVYSGTIGIIVFKKNAGQGGLFWEHEVFLEKGVSEYATFEIPVQWPAGEYKAELAYNEGYTGRIASVDFTVTNEVSAISDINADATAAEYYTLGGVRLNRKPANGAYIIKQGGKAIKQINNR